MYPAKFDYYRASSVGEAVAMLQQHDDAKVLAGGHSLIPAMKLRLSMPATLIDIGGVADLKKIGSDDEHTIYGAMVTYAEVVKNSESTPGALHDCVSIVGDAQVRNRGTLGGSLAHNDPAGDFPAVALALGARVHVTGPSGSRVIPAEDFLVGLMETALGPADILTEVHIPKDTGASAYAKFENPASGYAIAGVAVSLTKGSDGTISKARVALTGATDHAQRLHNVEAALEGSAWTEENLKAAAAIAGDGMDFGEDIHADSTYRASLTRTLTEQALTKAAGRA